MDGEQSGNTKLPGAAEPLRPRHVPVLVREALDFLSVRPDGIYIDATLGAGGHAEEILKRLESGRLLGLDRDPEALQLAGNRLAGFGNKLMIRHGNFAQIDTLHAASGFPPADGVLADLGLSSMQLEDASRGFSFHLPGRLDMRMDPGSETTAADLVNYASERELADIFFELGEERHSRRIARAIMKARPFRLTTELAQVVTRAIPSRAGLHQIHPATRSFMALRLAVNKELENLNEFLGRVLTVLRPGGRVVILSFHSLEDRRVKQGFRCWQDEGRATILTRKVVRPADEEIQTNPRARSAKLRAAEKQETGNRE
ncbi:MAG: 16S rRNA (cytosine(1402)-N(4))-methyltransferase RsmH [Terriglobia bacterium]